MATCCIRPLAKSGEAFLWEMLYYALYVPPGQEPFPKEIVNEPEIARYVLGWGKPHDKGFVAVEKISKRAIGAAWYRLFAANQQGYGYISEDIPELSIALLPAYRNQGIGTKLLNSLIEEARTHYPAISLSVSTDNPAARLYQRLGFEVIERQGTSLVMIKKLSL